MSIETRIVCDKCMKVDPDCGWAFGSKRRPVHRIRHVLKSRGWKVALPNGEDLCPQCAEALKEVKREA
jgi:uncharacterized protein with PIN domain